MEKLGKLEWFGLALYPVMGAMAAEKPIVGALLGLAFSVLMLGLVVLTDLTRSRRE